MEVDYELHDLAEHIQDTLTCGSTGSDQHACDLCGRTLLVVSFRLNTFSGRRSELGKPRGVVSVCLDCLGDIGAISDRRLGNWRIRQDEVADRLRGSC